MALKEEFENTGNWLFRWRSYLPLTIVVMFVLALLDANKQNGGLEFSEEWICLIVSFFGLGIRIITIGHTPRKTSGRNTKHQVAESLNTTGIYSIVRNPLYLGNFFMGLGIALFPGLWYLTLIYVLAFWLYYERIIFAEEAFLREKFGEVYLEWANRTPVFIPSFGHYQSASMPFSIRNILRREYNGVFAVILVLFLLELTGDIIVQQKLEFDFEWQWMLGVGFILWSGLRSLNRYTKLLNVAGR